jgi:hypothetical protein
VDKNETKNIAIIMLVIFLAFSVIVNVYYYVETRAARSNNSLSAFRGFHLPQNASVEDQNGALFPSGSFLLGAI